MASAAAHGVRLAEVWDVLPRAIRTVIETPSEATGLADRGRLHEGSSAEIVRVRPMTATPVMRGTWCRGRQVG